MQVLEVGGEDARNKWSDMVDTAFRGGEVVVKRHKRKVAVLVGYEQWSALKKMLYSILRQRSQDIAQGNYLTQEQLDAELKKMGIIQ